MSAISFWHLEVRKRIIRLPDGSLREDWTWNDPDGTPRSASREIQEYVEPPADRRLARLLLREEWNEVMSDAYRDDAPEALPVPAATQSDGRELVCAEKALLADAEAQPPKKPQRVRRLSFAQAQKEGGPIASVTDRPDGSRTFTFGQSEMAKEAAHGEEPPSRSLFKTRTLPTMKVVL